MKYVKLYKKYMKIQTRNLHMHGLITRDSISDKSNLLENYPISNHYVMNRLQTKRLAYHSTTVPRLSVHIMLIT